MAEQNPPTWADVNMRLPHLMNELKKCQLSPRDSKGRLPPDIPEKPGIYVFYKDKKPLYVGRSRHLRSRIMQHSRPRSGNTSATFAFLMALEEAEQKHIDCTNRTRAVLQEAPDFKPIYDAAKAKVRQMAVKVIEITDPIEQSVFEIYAALRLPTIRPYGYNDFETH